MAKEYKKVVRDVMNEDVILRFDDLNEEVFEDIILRIDHTTRQGKVAFSLVKNCKSSNSPLTVEVEEKLSRQP